MCIRRKIVFIGGAITIIALVAVLCAVLIKPGSNDDDRPDTTETYVDVTTHYGTLRGEWREGAQGRGPKFASFRGVPYAQPPLGDLRFRGPRPPQKWDAVLMATAQRSKCSQHATEGSEDCLYLNVYTPAVPSAQSEPHLPVYLFIHGGAFQFGSASEEEFGPHYLVQQGIVVVTFNYRVHVLACLGLDTEEVPGNAGLKDQLQALKWVHENIIHFGGDPSMVTLGGHSSGSASASWLSILPQTKGLIRAAIIQSGSALSGWGLTHQNVEFAKAIYTHLTGNSTDDFSEITRVAKSAAFEDLFYAAENATTLLQKTESIGSTINNHYSPYIERRPQGLEEKLITQDPESYIISNERNKIPIILGETTEEWTRFFSLEPFFDNDTLLDERIKSLKQYIPHTIFPGEATRKLLGINSSFTPPDEDQVLKDAQDFFFYNNHEPGWNLNYKMAKYLHQVFVMVDVCRTLLLRSKYLREPTYAFVFTLRSDYSEAITDLPEYFWNDVVHGDEMHYIWHKPDDHQDYYGNGTASKTMRRLVPMFANFIKYLDPTPHTDEIVDVKWRPVRQDDPESYLEITENLRQRNESLLGKNVAFWSRVYASFRDNKSP